MKIQYALMSCNADPRYTEYWPTVARAWLKLAIRPVCLFISDNPIVKLPEVPGGIVHTFSPLDDVHISIQSTTLRFWACRLYPNDTVIVSDIDLIPLARHFFCTQLAPYSDHAYLHLNHSPGSYFCHELSNIPEKRTYLSQSRIVWVCFHIAKGAVMHKVLQFSHDWKTAVKKTVPYYLHAQAKIKSSSITYTSYKGTIPRCGEELYTAIRLHYSNYFPIFYVSHYPKNLYRGHIDAEDIYGRKRAPIRSYTFAHFTPLRYSKYKPLMEAIIKGNLPRYPLMLNWLIYQSYRKRRRFRRVIALWLFVTLATLVLVSFRMLVILRLPLRNRESNQEALACLACQRKALLEQNPGIKRFHRRLFGIRNRFFTK